MTRRSTLASLRLATGLKLEQARRQRLGTGVTLAAIMAFWPCRPVADIVTNESLVPRRRHDWWQSDSGTGNRDRDLNSQAEAPGH